MARSRSKNKPGPTIAQILCLGDKKLTINLVMIRQWNKPGNCLYPATPPHPRGNTNSCIFKQNSLKPQLISWSHVHQKCSGHFVFHRYVVFWMNKRRFFKNKSLISPLYVVGIWKQDTPIKKIQRYTTSYFTDPSSNEYTGTLKSMRVAKEFPSRNV